MALDRQSEYARILASFEVLSVPADARAEILEALHAPNWDWFTQCDGCTAVSEVYWPTRYFPPCLRHDYDWAVGNPIPAANLRFYRLQRIYGMSRFRASLRFAGVTLAYGWRLLRKIMGRGDA